MRTIIDVPKTEIDRLDQIKDTEKVSRNVLINRAINMLLATYETEEVDAFALWQPGSEESA
ncbi:hypothetical protein QX776_16070 [Alteromonadaceae bacterium BrNp21-10]|nr:hypothetical protein [Alteromonadaceae bacterium BrNp21-10]